MDQVEIEDMDVMKSAMKHNKLHIASLKRKFARETKRKMQARGESTSDEDILVSDWEDASVITDATAASNKSTTSVRNALKEKVPSLSRRRRFLRRMKFEVQASPQLCVLLMITVN